MRLFRRRKHDEQAPDAAAAPRAPEPNLPVATPPAESAGTTEDPTKPKRRRGSRGSRGGRGRKKTGAAGAETAASADAPKARARPAEKDKAEKAEKPDRKPERRSARSSTRRRVPAKRPPLPPAKRELIVSVDVGEQRVAVLEDGVVAEVYLARPERRAIAGNIYLGTVDNVLPGMEAAFVEIGLERNGFLYVDEIVVPELEGKRHGKKIQDLISRGQEIMVQAVKDPMKTKGPRLTTEISLPGRFLVFVPNGEGMGVSRRLEDDERARLKDILKKLPLPDGGVIVRTAAEGASAEDIERDLVFLQRLWRAIQARAKNEKAPALVYQEAALPLRVVRDLFTSDFERAVIDHERTFKRVVGYLKKTSPHMVERVERYKEATPLMEALGVDEQIRSTLNRRVDLPSGGYLVFDYAEAFTVVDVNTGRYVGSRSKTSGARLEDTITKNNLEAVKEVVRQLRLRDIGGIIVIDFIDMANPKNRAAVEEALRTELERDRTKTYVVEISPLGLVEMTRQNVTDGPREILTKKCPTCSGDGIVVSEVTAAVDVERRLRVLAAEPRAPQAFKIELNARVASVLIGPGAERLKEIEEATKRSFVIETRDDVHTDHLAVLATGKLEELAPKGPVAPGDEVEVKLGEVDRHDPHAACGKLESIDVVVADTASLVGKKVKVRIERVLDGVAYATPLGRKEPAEPPITAESEAEKPTRKPPARKGGESEADPEGLEEIEEGVADAEDEPADGDEPEADSVAAAADPDAPPKKKTRRGSRGGRGRKKKTAAAAGTTAESNGSAPDEAEPDPKPETAAAAPKARASSAPRIHVPDDSLGREGDEDEDGPGAAEGSANGDEPQPAKKRTRRGSRGGRGRKKKSAVAAGAPAAAEEDVPGDDPEPEPEPEPPLEPAAEATTRRPRPEPAAPSPDGGYVPMSEWLDDVIEDR